MSYRIGHHERKRARDFIGCIVNLHRAHFTRGSDVFSPGEALEIRRVFAGRVDLKRLSDGARITGLSGFDFDITAEPEPQR